MSGSDWTVTEESILALENMAKQLQELEAAIKKETNTLEQVYEQNKDGLGYHSASIKTLIDEIKSIEEEASRPVKILVLKLTKAAAIRRGHINNKRYGNGRKR